MLKNSKADFIKDHNGRYRDHCSGNLQWVRKIVLHSKYTRKSGRYSQGAGGSGQTLRESIREKGGFWLNPPNRVLAQDSCCDHCYQGWVEGEALNQVWRVIRFRGWEIFDKPT